MSVETTERPGGTVRGSSSEVDSLRDVGSLLSQLGHDVGGLVTTEVSLAKAEIGESLNDAKKGVISLITGAVILFAGLIVLLNGVASTLATLADLPAWASFLIVGAVVSIIGGVLLANSKSKLSADNLALNRTEKSLRRDQQVAEEHLS